MRRRDRLSERIAGWLEAELGGLDEAAESSLRQVFHRLPMPTPSASLTSAILARLELRSAAPAVAEGWAFRVLVGSFLALAGLTLALAPSVLLPWLRTLRLSWLVDWGNALLIGTAQRAEQAATVWRVLGDIGETVAEALTTPSSLALLIAALVLSFGALRALSGLVPLERRNYV